MKQTYKIFLNIFLGFVVSTLCYAQNEQVLSSIELIQNKLSEDTAVLIYANVDQSNMVQMLIMKENISGLERSGRSFVQNIMEWYGKDIKESPSDNDGEKDEFAMIIENYRTLLQNPTTNDKSREIGSRLYVFLLGDVRKQIEGKTRLLIVPDGILNFLPFETLVDEQGKYLVEDYQLSYIQSLGVWESLQNRHYNQERKALLALSPTRLHEIYALQDIVSGADILIGDDATENRIKALSASGKLAEYNVLHFATQAVVTPEIPERSALVLSQLEPTPNPSQEGNNTPLPPSRGEPTLVVQGEDGYLRISEIAQLNLRAGFVNLSGSETGLGKLYKGEGIVGFTQAFMQAGANGVLGTLWQIADESTAAFMIALYTLVEEESLTYAEAITEIKRRFIAGDFGENWKMPYFWAPFVYYGR